MSAVAPLEELINVHQELQALEMKHPEAYQDFAKLFKKHKGVGYKNIALMLMEEKTPQQLKDKD